MSQEKPMFREVFEAEEGPLLRYAYGLLRQWETAEDLVQEAFLRLHGLWDEVSNPRAWLYRTLRNLALNHLRDHKRETVTDRLPEGDGGDNPNEEVARLEAAGVLRMLMAEMAEEDQRLIRMKYDEGLKYQEISRRTGLSAGNVGYRLHHLLKGLADGLRRQGIEGARL